MKTSSGFGKFILLWSGELVSAVGSGLTSFGLSVYVFRMTGSAAATSLVALIAFFPTLILQIPAGVLADRMDRRLLMVLGDGLSAMGILYILLCMRNGGASLAQICLGVGISAIFSSLLEPAYRATITDLLTPEEYTKASGIVSLAGSARYLVSPILAGILLARFDIRLLLIIDICTFFLTVTATLIVRRNITSQVASEHSSFGEDLMEGFKTVTDNRGIFTMMLLASAITLFMGTIQILIEPMVLSFADSAVLGFTETFCAMGMVVSGIYLGIRGIQKNHVKVLCLSLCILGLSMIAIGAKEQIILIGASGFLFFCMLPFANSALDYLVRVNIPKELQGRAWGVIGFISQLGYVFAYGLCGLLADALAKATDLSVGRSSGYIIMIAGLSLLFLSLGIYRNKDVRHLEETAKEAQETLET